MGKIQMQLYVNGLDKVRRLERALRAVTEDGVPVTAACAKENLQYEWFRRFVSQDIDADRDGQKAAVTVTWDDWSTWQEQLLRNTVGEITPVPEGFDEIYRKIAAECLSKEEREVVRLKYEEMLSLEEVAAQMGITANKVRHILAATLRKLRNPYLRWQLCLGADYTKALQELHTAQTEYDQAILKKEEELDRTIREKVRELQARTQELQEKTRELDEQPLEDALRCKLRKIPLEQNIWNFPPGHITSSAGTAPRTGCHGQRKQSRFCMGNWMSFRVSERQANAISSWQCASLASTWKHDIMTGLPGISGGSFFVCKKVSRPERLYLISYLFPRTRFPY